MKKKKKGFLLAFPAISGFLFFYLIPFLIVLWYSVSFGIGKREFVGLDNYKELFKEEEQQVQSPEEIIRRMRRIMKAEKN